LLQLAGLDQTVETRNARRPARERLTLGIVDELPSFVATKGFQFDLNTFAAEIPIVDRLKQLIPNSD
jgi:hypothetical protein